MNADLNEIRMRVRAFLRRQPALTTEDAEDVEQETLLRLYTYVKKGTLTLQQIEELAKLGYTVARNKRIDQVRTRTRNPVAAASTGVMGPKDEERRSEEERICADIFG